MVADRAVYRAFQYGLGIFGLTALIGLANATRIFGALSRDTLLTHLHSGTLGWITMGVIGVAVWMFGGRGGALARNVGLTGAATALYVLAFWSGDIPGFPNFPFRALFGAILLVAIYGWWWWVLRRSLAEGLGTISIPKLSVLLALTTLIIGSTIGVIVQLQFALGVANQRTGDLIGTHASAQVGGYLVLVAAAIAEWMLVPNGRRTTAGVIQASALFLGGIFLAVGTLVNVTPLLLLSNLLQVIGIVMIAVRVGRHGFGVSWTAGGARHTAITLGFLVVALVLIVLLTQMIVAAKGDFTQVPPGFIHALDHSMFVGVMTNVLFGAILALTANGERVWPWADNLIFWGLNIGAASFIAVLLFVGSGYTAAGPFQHPVAYTASLMGLAALLGIATLQQRLRGARVAAAVPAPA